eukprot:12119599-Karenia_brevis.AAC.1
MNYVASSNCLASLPYPSASDHKPVTLVFRPVRAPKRTYDRGAKRISTVPEWLLGNVQFDAQVQALLSECCETRRRGLMGIVDFNESLLALAQNFLRSQAVQAQSTIH